MRRLVRIDPRGSSEKRDIYYFRELGYWLILKDSSRYHRLHECHSVNEASEHVQRWPRLVKGSYVSSIPDHDFGEIIHLSHKSDHLRTIDSPLLPFGHAPFLGSRPGQIVEEVLDAYIIHDNVQLTRVEENLKGTKSMSHSVWEARLCLRWFWIAHSISIIQKFRELFGHTLHHIWDQGSADGCPITHVPPSDVDCFLDPFHVEIMVKKRHLRGMPAP